MSDSQSQQDAIMRFAPSPVAGRRRVLTAVVGVVTLIACLLTARNASAGGLPAILTPAEALARYPAGTVFVIVFDPRAGTSVLIPAADMPRGGSHQIAADAHLRRFGNTHPLQPIPPQGAGATITRLQTAGLCGAHVEIVAGTGGGPPTWRVINDCSSLNHTNATFGGLPHNDVSGSAHLNAAGQARLRNALTGTITVGRRGQVFFTTRIGSFIISPAGVPPAVIPGAASPAQTVSARLAALGFEGVDPHIPGLNPRALRFRTTPGALSAGALATPVVPAPAPALTMAQRLRGFTRSAPYQMGSALAQPIIIDQAMDWISEPTLRGSRRLAELRIANGMVTAEEQAAVDRAAATARAAREAAERHRIMNNIPNNDVAPSYTDIQRGIETRVTPGWGTASMSAPPPVPFWTRVRRSIFGY